MTERPHYQQPDWFTRRVFNLAVAAATRAGVSVLTLDTGRYLVAPRGETQWVRNLRAGGGGELRVGRRREPFSAQEVATEDKVVVLRAYLRRWKWEVGTFFGGDGPDSTDEDIRAEALRHPVFRLGPPAAGL